MEVVQANLCALLAPYSLEYLLIVPNCKPLIFKGTKKLIFLFLYYNKIPLQERKASGKAAASLYKEQDKNLKLHQEKKTKKKKKTKNL